MTRIRIPQNVASIAPERMAALVTHAIVSPIGEDSKPASLPGTAWVRFFEARGYTARRSRH